MSDFSPVNIFYRLQKLDIHKSSGNPFLNNHRLKLSSDALSGVLSTLFKLIYRTGNIPDTWKEAIVIPVFKAGSRLQPTNYRPISLLNPLGKLLESYIVECLETVANLSEAIPNIQHGFRKGRSSEKLLTESVTSWCNEINHNKCILLVAIDFSKAFDKVPHDILINKLSLHVGSQDLLNLLSNYLLDRKMNVDINGVKSISVNVPSGVPQGSILGPTLFNFFSGDIPVHPIVNCRQYADDIMFWVSMDNDPTSIDNSTTIMQNQLDLLFNWSTINKLPINGSKSNYMIVSRNQGHISIPDLCIGSEPLSEVDNFKYLGLYIDNRLSWSVHSSKTYIKVLRCWHALKPALKYASKKDKLTVVSGKLYPLITYAGHIWFCQQPKKDTSRLERLMNKILKYTANDDRLSVADEITLKGLTFLYNYRNDIELLGLKNKREHGKNTRSNFNPNPFKWESTTHDNCKKCRLKNTHLAKSFPNNVLSMWNTLPLNVENF